MNKKNISVLTFLMLFSVVKAEEPSPTPDANLAIAKESRTLDPLLLKRRYDFTIKSIQKESNNAKCTGCHKSGNFYPGDIPRLPVEIEQASQTFLNVMSDKNHSPLLKGNNNLAIVIVLMGDMRTDVLKSRYLDAMKLVQNQSSNSQCLSCHTGGFTIPIIPKTLETIKPAALGFLKVMADNKHADLVRNLPDLQSAVKLMAEVR